MYRLLIVDDEPFTVEGLYEMLSEITELELDLYRAYSAEEAIQWLSRTKMDIVLSDIRMPEMDGLQLQQWILAKWPRCKVIFLTGINDILFAQRAQRAGGIDYILKTEGDEAIIRSIKGAIHALQEDMNNEDILLRAKGQLSEMLPILRREWFLSIMEQQEGGAKLIEEWNRGLQQLQSNVSANENVLLVCGRIDQWDASFTISDQTLMLYAVQNIAEEYMERVNMLPVMLGGSYFAWLFQPKASEEGSWDNTISFVQGTLESIQQTYKALLKLSVSFISHEEAIEWHDISKVYHQLRQTLVLGLGNGEEMILIYRGEDSAQPVKNSGQLLSKMERAVEMRQEELFQDLLASLFAHMPNQFSVYAQHYYAVVVLLLNQWNKIHQASPQSAQLAETMINKLLNIDTHSSKEHAVQFISEVGRALFKIGRKEQDDRTERIITKLNHYIEEQLHTDLSLTVLADAVYLNPSYLSNLYKTYTGRNISEYITELRVERAKELLSTSQDKVQDIAVAVGFETAAYFTRFFKKHVGVTPQEYRSRLI